MIQKIRHALTGLYYGWRMIGLGCAVRILGGGLHHYGFTVFFLPVSRDLGLTRAATSLVFSLARAQGAIEGPLAGYLIDRFGPRPVILTAVLLAGAGYMLLAGVYSFPALLLVYMGIISLSYQAGFMDATMVIANTWFIRRRATAMACISASISMGGVLITPLLAFGVHTWGWRPAALGAGIAFLVGGLPLALLIRRSPESMGLLPDGNPPRPNLELDSSRGENRPGSSSESDYSLRQAFRSHQFWLLVLATTLRVTCLSAVMVHFIPIMVWKGLTEQRAALFLGLYAILGLPSHLMIGWLGDRLPKPRLMAISMVAAALSVLILLYASREWHIWLALLLFTPAESIFPLSWATVGDFFGRKNFAKIRGNMSFFYMWGGVLSPVVAGAIYDKTQSYESMIWALVALFLITAYLYGILVKPHIQ
jgi:sugar phosphate permease